MRFYLAGRYTRRLELAGYAEDLRALGHQVTSRWLLGEHQWDGAAQPIAEAYEAGLQPPEAVRFAQDDVEDLDRADVVISFTETPRGNVLDVAQVAAALRETSDYLAHGRLVMSSELDDLTTALNRAASTLSRGGRHVEFGFALGTGKRLIVVGPRENVFHLLDLVEQHDDWSSALAALQPVEVP